MSFDAHKNFAKVTVPTGYNSSVTTIVLSTGTAALLPTAPFYATWWNSTDYPDPSDDPLKEIVRVTFVATDTLTITRGQSGTNAAAHNIVGKVYKLVSGMFAELLQALELRMGAVQIAYASTVATDASLGSTFEVGALTGALTLANPTNPTDAQIVTWIVPQDATGGRVVTLGNKFVAPSSATSPLAWSTAANAVDLLAAKYRASIDKWYIVSFVFGYPNS